MAFTYTSDDFDSRQDHEFAFKDPRNGLKSIVLQNDGGQLMVSIELDAKKDGLKKRMEEMLQQGGVKGVQANASYGDAMTTYVSFETKDPKQLMAALAALAGNPGADVLGMVSPDDLAKIAGTLVQKGAIDPLQSGYMTMNTVTLNGFERKGVDFAQPFMGIRSLHEDAFQSGIAGSDPVVRVTVDNGHTGSLVTKALRDGGFDVNTSPDAKGITVTGHPDKNPDFNNVSNVLARAGILPDSIGKTVADQSAQVPQASNVQSSFMAAPAKLAAPATAAPAMQQRAPAAPSARM